jgi:hypothetical protein
VDRYNTFGLGANVPIASANGGEALIAVVDGKLVNLRMPYPLGFFTKNVDGRIDNPETGWKGRGWWTTTGTRTSFHNEGGVDNYPKVYKVQTRPDPLAHCYPRAAGRPNVFATGRYVVGRLATDGAVVSPHKTPGKAC